MLAIFEGIDKSGKTTLVEEVHRLLGAGVTVVHASKPTQHPLDEYVMSLEKYTPAMLEHTLLDRWHLGETVWPHVFGRETQYDAAMHRYTELFLMSRGALLVLSEGRESAIMRRIEGDDGFAPEQVPEILLRFKVAARNSLLNRVSYDIERESLTDFAFSVVRGAYQQEWDVTRVSNLTDGWVGYPRPHVLYVGEQVGPGGPDTALPFVPYKNTSGWSLMKALPHGAFAIVNALKPNGDREELLEIFQVMSRPRVVALGNVADRVLSDLKIPHGAAPHPQFVRRFHAAAITDGKYFDMLRMAGWGKDMRGELKSES